MKFKLAALAFAGVASIGATMPAHSGALAMSDLTINGLGLVATLGSTDFLDLTGLINITAEQRTGNATSLYNGVAGVNPNGAEPPNKSSSVVGATVDVKYRCAGDCGGAAALYAGGGGFENNTTTHLAPVPGVNFALADMLIEGSALAGPAVTGLTRANAQTIGGPGTETGSANATILNSATLTTTFLATETFSAYLAVNADSYLRLWVNFPPESGEVSSAAGGFGWNASVVGLGVDEDLRPGALNRSRSVADGGDAGGAISSFAFTGFLYSGLMTFTGGQQYTFTANQSSNVSISNTLPMPEPGSLALIGVALLGAGIASRRALKKSV